ncbi:thioredoxin domain-containing protein [Sporocytophaga myxococcoides]|uniref:thioredoxin domain-containing protein n=1 Tax=Sporocytophaga myxococcoides TaxID=153721 RepID=UPI001FE1ACB9|nr:thioredoxin domain-containing protein [Sporocytophaga myxococcoides]
MDKSHTDMQGDTTTKKANKLLKETSPYLKQHAYNPVQWQSWGNEALDQAKKEDKPIIVSIGYSSCHWCHVMERESFEDEGVAEIMNAGFINIKVDREERPDLDHIYMEAIQQMNLGGGWPLNVFLTPDAKPFFGGTYFPREQWKHVLNEVLKAFQDQRKALEDSADTFTNSLNASELQKYGLTEDQTDFSIEDLNAGYKAMSAQFDTTLGGMDKEPKFPMPTLYFFLLRYYHLTKDDLALRQLVLTLDEMAKGGIYDQIGGGFARYSTDAEWFAPHFEKMLCDNGQLMALYSEAYTLTKNTTYKEVVRETYEWLKREMTSSEGGFYSALDADSEGVEGKFYTWTLDEVEKLIPEDILLLRAYYNVSENGNWEHGQNILFKAVTDEMIAKYSEIPLNDLKTKIAHWKKTLLQARSKRPSPGLDDKILSGWNGIMLKGLTEAYRTFDEDEYLQLALANAAFIKNKLIKNKVLFRNYKDGKASQEGFLEDYAWVIDAYISLYQATFDEQWLTLSKELTEHVVTHFYDAEENLFYFTSDNAEKLIARKKEIFDNVIPASNSVMAQNLQKLGILLERSDFCNLAKIMAAKMKKLITTDPSWVSNWASLVTSMIEPTAEIAISGSEYLNLRKEIDKTFYPNKILAGTASRSEFPLLVDRPATGDQTRIFVCYNNTCQWPVTSVDDAWKQINKTS